MDIFNQIGKMALGSRLRRVSEQMTANAAQVYEMYGINLKPKWFPVYYVLAGGQDKTVTEMAAEIGHSHPFVSKIVGEMARKGLVTEKKDTRDGRKNVVCLSKKGKEITAKMEAPYTDVNNTVDELLNQTRHNLWKAIEEWEHLLQQEPYIKRVVRQKKMRESKEVQIVEYQPKYKKAFKELNEEWISRYFKMEKEDYAALDNPKGYILNKGGYIFVALYHNEPVGVCAMVKMNDGVYDFELAKMAVSPKAQGKHIGWLLGNAIIENARSVKAKKIFLESNTKLTPAINLYYKLGFQKVITPHASPYQRSNIQMELVL